MSAISGRAQTEDTPIGKKDNSGCDPSRDRRNKRTRTESPESRSRAPASSKEARAPRPCRRGKTHGPRGHREHAPFPKNESGLEGTRHDRHHQPSCASHGKHDLACSEANGDRATIPMMRAGPPNGTQPRDVGLQRTLFSIAATGALRLNRPRGVNIPGFSRTVTRNPLGRRQRRPTRPGVVRCSARWVSAGQKIRYPRGVSCLFLDAPADC